MSERPTLIRAARVRSNSYSPDDRTIDVVWSTGAPVARTDWWTGDDYTEVLSMDPAAIRLGRLNAGAPLLDSHDSSELSRVLGNIVPGSARIEGGKGLATVRLSEAKGAADAVLKIAEGSVRNVSVGYLIHAQTETEDATGKTRTATDWEPVEISACAVPADPDAQFRSAGARRSRPDKRTAEIRRLAAKVRMPKFGEAHIRRGTTADAFFDALASRLNGSTVKKPTSELERFRAGMSEGARHWARVAGKPVRDDDAVKKPKGDDDEDDRDEDVTDLDDDEDHKPIKVKDPKSDEEEDVKRHVDKMKALIRKFGPVHGL